MAKAKKPPPATFTLIVEVRNEHYYNGMRCHSEGCAVSLAIVDALKAAGYTQIPAVEVLYTGVQFTFAERRGFAVGLPAEALELVQLFDMGSKEQRQKLTPLTFSLELPESAKEMLS